MVETQIDTELQVLLTNQSGARRRLSCCVCRCKTENQLRCFFQNRSPCDEVLPFLAFERQNTDGTLYARIRRRQTKKLAIRESKPRLNDIVDRMLNRFWFGVAIVRDGTKVNLHRRAAVHLQSDHVSRGKVHTSAQIGLPCERRRKIGLTVID